MDKNLIIIGAGSHCRPCIEAAEKNNHNIIEIIDVDYKGQEETILNHKVIGGLDKLDNENSIDKEQTLLFLAVGNNKKRKELYEEFINKGFDITTIIHPTAIILDHSKIGKGSLICAGAIIGTDTIIQENVIINTGTIIDHNSDIGPHSHIAPGVKIAGKVKVGEETFIGIGSCIIDKVNIGRETTIGAGSVVINDIPEKSTYVGVPAKRIK
jgi:sugar O-acyltransferase (sialic acid O-acetyltransferase NeuD family)